jgi:transcriptional regulator
MPERMPPIVGNIEQIKKPFVRFTEEDRERYRKQGKSEADIDALEKRSAENIEDAKKAA